MSLILDQSLTDSISAMPSTVDLFVANHLHAGKETDVCDTTVAFLKAVLAVRSRYTIPEWVGIHPTDTATS